MIIDEAELRVQTGVLRQMSSGVVGLGPEHRTGLVHPLEDADQLLFEELWRLREIGRSAEPVDLEHVRAGLGCRADDLRRMDLGESTGIQGTAESTHRGRRDPMDSGQSRMAQRHLGMVEDGRQCRRHSRPIEIERRCFRRLPEHLVVGIDQLGTAGRLVVGDHGASDAQHCLDSQPGRGAFDHDLSGPAAVADDHETDGFEFAQPVQPAGDGDGAADVPR